MKIHNYGNDYVAQHLVKRPTVAKEVEDAENTVDTAASKADEKISGAEETIADGASEGEQEAKATPPQKKGKKKRK